MNTTLTVLALLGLASAEQLRKHKKTYQSVHVDDMGFIVLGEKTFVKKESDWLANGDAKDDLEVQSELGDSEDPVVMDNGFGLASGNWADNSWKANHYKGSLNDFVQVGSEITHKKKLRNRNKKESDWLANGDGKDDLEVQSELGDPDDPVVMDNGFGLASGNWADNSWKANHYKGSLNDFLQLRATRNNNKNKKKSHKKKGHKKSKKGHKKPAKKANVMLGKESDWIANADAADDKEVESEMGDGDDEVVQDSGFALSGGLWKDQSVIADQYNDDLNFVQLGEQQHRHNKPGRQVNVQLKKESDWIANADAADDKEVESEMGDGDDEVVQDSGFALSGGIWMDQSVIADQYKPEQNFVQIKDDTLFMRDSFKENHPHMIKNEMYTGGDGGEVMLTQTDDHFYTDDFKASHPHKVINQFFSRDQYAEDMMNMQVEYNEIDNFNPGAQKRLAKYMAMDI